MLEINGQKIERLGMGCWAIGGPFFAGEAPLGYRWADDNEALRTVETAYERGIRFFDTAAVYGAGHSEKLLGQALAGRDDVVIATKFGFRFDPAKKQILGEETSSETVDAAIEASRNRLKRDRLDLVFLHLNSLSPAAAAPLFDRLDGHCEAGRIGACGWSTDFPESVASMAERPNFTAVEHAMNIFVDAPSMMRVIEKNELLSINRSPLAMGILTGKFGAGEATPRDDIRQNTLDWMSYFKDGRVVPAYVEKLDAVRELLMTDGRTLAQGALAWLWAKSPRTLPIPGARTQAQAEENAGALARGPLSPAVMTEIETLIEREPEGEPRER